MQTGKYIFLLLCLIMTVGLKGQVVTKEHVQLYLKEFNVYFTPSGCNAKMDVELYNSKGVLSITLSDCKGKMFFKQYNSSGKLVVEGAYINSLDTLKKYSVGKSAIDGSRSVRVFSYFQPLPDGVWRYGVNKKVVYNNGIKE